MRLNKLRRLVQHAEVRREILAVDEQLELFNFVGNGIALAFSQNQEVIPVSGFLQLGGVGARADRLEVLLEQDLGFALGRSGSRIGPAVGGNGAVIR